MAFFGSFVTGGLTTKTLLQVSKEDSSKARNTNLLLIRAMEHSKFGPGVGEMDLDDETRVMPFLRCAKNFFPYSMRQDFSRTFPAVLRSLEQQNQAPPLLPKEDVQAMFNNMNKIRASNEDRFGIAKASVNPIIMLLLFDHGVTTKTHYTPMASPRANGRSLVSEHVEDVCSSVLRKPSNVLACEDYAIAPFYVVSRSSKETNSEKEIEMEEGSGNGDEKEEELEDESAANKKNSKEDESSSKGDNKGEETEDDGSPIAYKCILNRDRYSTEGDVVEKKADCLSTDILKSTYATVSYSVNSRDLCVFDWRHELRGPKKDLRWRARPVFCRDTFFTSYAVPKKIYASRRGRLLP